MKEKFIIEEGMMAAVAATAVCLNMKGGGGGGVPPRDRDRDSHSSHPPTILLQGSLKTEDLKEDEYASTLLTLSCDEGVIKVHPGPFVGASPRIRGWLEGQNFMSDPTFLHFEGYEKVVLEKVVDMVYHGTTVVKAKMMKTLYTLLTDVLEMNVERMRFRRVSGGDGEDEEDGIKEEEEEGGEEEKKTSAEELSSSDDKENTKSQALTMEQAAAAVIAPNPSYPQQQVRNVRRRRRVKLRLPTRRTRTAQAASTTGTTRSRAKRSDYKTIRLEPLETEEEERELPCPEYIDVNPGVGNHLTDTVMDPPVVAENVVGTTRRRGKKRQVRTKKEYEPKRKRKSQQQSSNNHEISNNGSMIPSSSSSHNGNNGIDNGIPPGGRENVKGEQSTDDKQGSSNTANTENPVFPEVIKTCEGEIRKLKEVRLPFGFYFSTNKRSKVPLGLPLDQALSLAIKSGDEAEVGV